MRLANNEKESINKPEKKKKSKKEFAKEIGKIGRN